MSDILAAALAYAELGWHVFPCVPGGKTPLTKRGLLDATTDPERIRQWWAQWPTANVAINCGASNLAVIDLDMKNGVDGTENWRAWCKERGVKPNGTTQASTPSGGTHLYYYGRIRSTSSKIAPGVDSRGDGGYVVAPPSIIGGRTYTFDPESGADLYDLPQEAADAAGEARERTVKTEPVTVTASGSLAELVAREVPLHRKGKELCGPCPWCGGTDRFVVSWDGQGRDGRERYYCRKCERSGDSVSWLIDREQMHPVAAKDARGVPVPAEFRPTPAAMGTGVEPSHLFAPVTHPSAEVPQPAKPATSPLSPDETNIRWLATFERIEFPMVCEGLLPAGIVGGINAEGGTGKTYLLIAMFTAIAAGIEWGPFRPTRPHKCLLLLGEDPQDVVRNRIHDIARAILPQSRLDLFALNFHAASVRGTCGPLMSLVGGNPAPSSWADWLDASMGLHEQVEVVGLDPLRKFYGLDENKNEHAHAFIGFLEAVTLRRSATVIYNHHVAKMARELAVGQITGRGASGLSDNCRWMAAMRTVDEKTAEYLELEGNHKDFVEFAVTKSNYAPMLPRPAYFQRGEHGVLAPVAIDQNRMAAQVEYLADLIDGLRLSVRDLVKEARAADVRAAMRERFIGFKKDDFHRIVEHGTKAGRFLIAQFPSGPRNVMRDSVMVVKDES